MENRFRYATKGTLEALEKHNSGSLEHIEKYRDLKSYMPPRRARKANRSKKKVNA